MPAAQLPALFNAGNQSRANTMGILRGSKDEFTVSITAEIGGKKISFSATFRRRDWKETAKLSTEINEALIHDPVHGWALMESSIRDDLVRWDKLPGEDGEVEYNSGNVDLALSMYAYLSALYQGWTAAQMQKPSANSKN